MEAIDRVFGFGDCGSGMVGGDDNPTSLCVLDCLSLCTKCMFTMIGKPCFIMDKVNE